MQSCSLLAAEERYPPKHLAWPAKGQASGTSSECIAAVLVSVYGRSTLQLSRFLAFFVAFSRAEHLVLKVTRRCTHSSKELAHLVPGLRRFLLSFVHQTENYSCTPSKLP